jgi:HK97 family phage major capsid protein
VPDELRFATEDAIFNGDGVGKPLGFMNSAALVSVTRQDASNVLYQDVINMWARRWAGANDYVWLVNQDVMPELDTLIHNGTGSIPPRFVDYTAEGIMRMKGRPVIEVEYAQTLGTAGDIVLFSPSAYQLIDKASGIQSAASIHVAFVNSEMAFRFLYRVDGAPLWHSTLTPFKGSNEQSPYVALSASS